MIRIPDMAERRIAVFGLGVSGLAAAQALGISGALVAAWDDDDSRREEARETGVPVSDLNASDFATLDGLVLSPGVPLTHPAPHRLVERAREAGCPVIGDIELLSRAAPEATLIAVTGTNGKSTTTALIGHVLSTAGRRTEIGGNLGTPALALAPLGRDGAYVLELSSFQLDLTQKASFDIAVLLNITPDHLDRHGDMEGYVAAKRRIFRDRPKPGSGPGSGSGSESGPANQQIAVVGIDDPHCIAIRDELVSPGTWRVIPISTSEPVADGVYVLDGTLHDALAGEPRAAAELKDIDTLPGAHNWQNAAAAYAVARAAGVSIEAIVEGLASYPGLPHRQERVGVIGKVLYVNDSKATNAEAAAKALASYETIYWIAGGRSKEGGFEPVMPNLSRVAHSFLIGEAAESFAQLLSPRVGVSRCGTLSNALDAAHEMAQRESRDGAVVLLSPACASFDQWANFEARGDSFRTKVAKLASGQPSDGGPS